MKSKQVFSLFSLLMILSLLLAACGAPPVEVIKTVEVEVTKIVAGTPVKEVQVVTATPLPPTPAPTKAPTAAKKLSDSVVIALQQEPDSMHPLLGEMQAKWFVLGPLHVGCMGQNEKTEWIPLGCESVPTIENGGAKIVGDGDDRHLEVTYKIRKDWRWTDGTPVTTKDIVYWWKLAMDPKFPLGSRGGVEKIMDIKSVDEKTAVVQYLSKKQVNQAIKGTLTGNVDFKAFKEDYVATYGTSWDSFIVDPVFWNNIYWLPEHILKSVPSDKQETSEYSRKPLGDGPYVLSEWKAGQEIVLTLSDKPFGLGVPKVKTITYRIFGDTAGVLAALSKGEVDAVMGNVGGLTEAEGPDLDAIEAKGQYKVIWNKGWDFEHIDLNTTKFPLDDVKVRQALALAIDRNAINKSVYYGKKAITDLPLPTGVWAYPPAKELSIYEFNLDKAKALLKEAGWDCSVKPCKKGGKELSFTFMTTDRQSRIKVAQILMEQWGKLNVGVNAQFLYGRQLFNTCQTGGPLKCRTFDAGMYTFSSDDSATFYSLYSCGAIPTKENAWSGQNNPGWCNKTAQDALNQSENNPEIALSREKRMPYLTTFFKELTKDVPVIMLYASQEPFPYRVDWKNFKPGPTQYSLATWNPWEWEVYK